MIESLFTYILGLAAAALLARGRAHAEAARAGLAVERLCAGGAGCVRGDALVNEVVLDLLRKLEERIVHVRVRLGRRLDVGETELVGEVLRLLGRDRLGLACAWGGQRRTLFSSQSLLLPTRILRTPSLACCSTSLCQLRMSIGQCDMRHTLEALLVRHVKDKENTHRAAVVCRGNGAETLLARGIPL